MKTRYVVLIVAAVLILAALACGSDNTGEKVDESEAKATQPPKVETYTVGDVIQVKDHTITLNSADVQGKRLKANFTVENKGSDDLTLSSIIHFSAKDDEGSKLELDIFDCDPKLDGSVLSGDKSKGNVCWKVTEFPPYKVYYEASLFGSGAVVWKIE